MIKVKVVDWPDSDSDDNFLIQCLKERYEVVISDEPDFLFYSVAGQEHLKYDCVRIFYTGEPGVPNFNECDYAISSEHLNYCDRHFRLPVYALYLDKKIQDREFVDVSGWSDRKFCNFIYSNETVGGGSVLRKVFCQRLMEYKHVDCPGGVLNNMTPPGFASRYDANWHHGKIDFIKKYKFTIAFENASSYGYTTEKLLQPLIAGSIPIYCGNPRVADEFDPESFINCSDYDNDFDAIIERIKEIEASPELAAKMLRTKPLREDFDYDFISPLKEFLYHIIEKGNRPFDKINKKEIKNDREKGASLNMRAYGRGVAREMKSYDRVVIYGDGIIGKQIGGLIRTHELCDIAYYVISRREQAQRWVNEIPVISVDELCSLCDGEGEKGATLVCVAVREEAQDSLISQLGELGFKNILAVSDFVINAVSEYANAKK